MLKTSHNRGATTFLGANMQVIKNMLGDNKDSFLGVGMVTPSVNEQNQTIVCAANFNYNSHLDVIN